MTRIIEVLGLPAIRLIVIYVILLSLLLAYGHSHFYRDPGSIFFDDARAFEEHYAQQRRQEVHTFLQKHNSSTSTAVGLDTSVTLEDDAILDNSDKSTASKDPQICVTFLTVRRKNEQYIEEAIASALVGLSSAERRKMHLGVFFAQTDLDQHPSYHRSWIHNMVDSVYSYDLPADRLKHLADLEGKEKKQVQEKSIFDYTYALDWCHRSGAPYALLLEGDIMLADSWFVQLLSAVKKARTHLHLDTTDWLYLRMFNQERSTGWASRHIGDNHELAIVLGIAMVVLCYKLIARCLCPHRRHLDNAILLVTCCIIVPSTVVLFFQAGKASLLPPRPGLRVENFGCCSQALLYPREQIPPLVKRLREQRYGQYDLMINRHAKVNRLRRLTLYPILVQHMGVQSARDNDDQARLVWSTAFESLNAAYLHRQHNQLVQELFNATLG